MEDNVVRMPDKVERLVMEINDHMSRADGYKAAATRNRDAWCNEIVSMCAAVAALKDEYKATGKFGRKFDESGIKLNKNERAAAVGMGHDIERAKKVLAASTSWSIEQIYVVEFQVPSVRKSIAEVSIGASTVKVTVPTQKAIDALKRLREKGAKITQKTVAKEAGVSETSVRRAFTMEQAVAAAAGAPVMERERPVPEIDPASLSLTAQGKLDALKRKLEKDMDYRVNHLAREKLASMLKSHYDGLDKRVKECQWLLNRKYPFNRLEFKKLMMVAHPDNSASKEMRDEVFTLINQRELILQPDVETELADKAAKARHADMDRAMREAQAWFAANPGKKVYPGSEGKKK